MGKRAESLRRQVKRLSTPQRAKVGSAKRLRRRGFEPIAQLYTESQFRHQPLVTERESGPQDRELSLAAGLNVCSNMV
jgi:hypothetical protein